MSNGFFTPLRYPGGKGKLAPYVRKLIEHNGLSGGTYIEPYAGGAAIALELLLTGVVDRVALNDLNYSVFAFWGAVLSDTDQLCARISDTPVNIETWHRQRQVQLAASPDPMDLAFSTFFMNRTNRSGILKAGVIGGKNQDGPWKLDARYNKEELLTRIAKIADYRSRIALSNSDAELFIREISSVVGAKGLMYCDPPYFVKGRDLYMNYYSCEDHIKIADVIRGLEIPWIVSYDNHPTIAALYKGLDSFVYTLSYSAAVRYRGLELMVFSPLINSINPIAPMRRVYESTTIAA